MEPDEIEQLLVKTARLTEENHRILRKMQQAESRRSLMRFINWIIVVAGFVALYYLVQPLIAEFKAVIESSQSIIQEGEDGNFIRMLEQLSEVLPSGEAEVESVVDPETSPGPEPEVLEEVE